MVDMIAPDFEAIPRVLRNLPRWVVWRLVHDQQRDRWVKPPLQANATNRRASSTDATTWATFDDASQAVMFGSDLHGVGLALGDGVQIGGQHLIALDLDDCVADGKPLPAAVALLDELGAQYVEVSPSGTGLRAFGLASEPVGKLQGQCRGMSVEVYSSGQYVTLTGRALKAGPVAPLRGDRLGDLVRAVRGNQGAADAADLATAALSRVSKMASVTADTVRDLWQVIEHLDASRRLADYQPWVQVGMALKSLEEAGQGYVARLMWERACERGNEARVAQGRKPGTAREIEAKWRELKPSSITHRSLFAMAMEDGWKPPAPRTDPVALAAAGPVATPTVAIRRVSTGDVWVSPPEDQRHVWGQCTPIENVTLLGAHGGTGKSTFALQLAVHHCVGKPFMGLPVEKGVAVYFSAEDDHKVLRRRLSEVCRASDVNPADLDHALILLDATDSPVLYRETRAAGAEFTGSFEELQRIASDSAASLVVIDNASDTFDGNEIDRGRVREFMRGLVTLARRTQSAVMLLVHVAKTTARSGDGDDEAYSGSTAWHNSARSRLSLTAVETNEGERVLKLAHQKSNLGPLQPPILMRFAQGGTLAPHGEQGSAAPLSRQAQQQAHQRALLALIDQAEQAGEQISAAPNSPANAFRSLQPRSGFPPLLDRRGCFTLLSRMKAEGLLTVAQKRTQNRKTVACWSVSEIGRALLQGDTGEASALFG